MKKLMKWGGIALVAVVGISIAANSGSHSNDDSPGAVKETTTLAHQDEAKAAPAEPAEPKLTSGQENALEAAQNYVDNMPFSKSGLIEQLHSKMGDGYAKKDAVFAANHVKVNWKAEAVEAAKNYLDSMPFSRSALIQQLHSKMGSGFTLAQATYAADKVL